MRKYFILTRLIGYLAYSLLVFSISGCSFFEKKREVPTILITIDSTNVIRNTDLRFDCLQLDILFFSGHYLFGSKGMNKVENTSIPPALGEIKDKELLSAYNYLIIPNEVIRDHVEVEKNMKLILIVLKTQNSIVAKKLVDFDIKKLKVLNISLDNNNIAIQP